MRKVAQSLLPTQSLHGGDGVVEGVASTFPLIWEGKTRLKGAMLGVCIVVDFRIESLINLSESRTVRTDVLQCTSESSTSKALI